MAGIDYNRASSERKSKETICDVHRDVYQALKKNQKLTEDEKSFLLERIEIAFKMGKSMDAKLRQYKNNYDNDWWNTAKKAWDWEELKGD
jgi:hypothetical protein